MLKVLIPVDGSLGCRHALECVIHRVWSREALDVHLIHVQKPQRRFAALLGLGPSKLADPEKSAEVFAQAAKVLQRGGVHYQTHVSLGNPAREIVRFAESNGFRSILIGSTRVGTISEILLGSVASQVLRMSRIPIEVVPAAPRSRLGPNPRRAAAAVGIGAVIYAVLD